jgi:hypothetical protein
MDRLGAVSVKQICYPGNRLSDGGLFRVGDVLSYRPALCLVEPLAEDTTRGRSVTRPEATYVYGSMLSGGILPVAVFLPDPAKRTPRCWESYALHQEVCDAFGLPRIEINLEPVGDEADDRFMGLHTQLAGAELYAETIARGLLAIGNRDEIARRAFEVAATLPQEVHTVRWVPPQQETLTCLMLRLRPRVPGGYSFRVIQPHTVGPFSPVLEVQTREPGTHGDSLRSLWDPYCHFDRQTYAVLDDRVVEAGGTCTVSIQASTKDPEYGSSRRPMEDWPDPAQRQIRPVGPIKVFSTVPLALEVLRYE